ncbi:MAG: PQQ-binding-like beta-propeller repeat protein [Bryobacteraceae bacterium]|nr:PQQ-binding-like beta-propeller repeat protein [Bryobacteraceae bacterium]
MRILLWFAAAAAMMQAQTDWPAYHGSADQTHFSTLDQINTSNVARLREVWRYDSGDAFPNSEMQCNPLVIGGVLYATTPKLRVVALDAATGREIWSFDPWEGAEVRGKQRSRGLVHWQGRIYVGARQWLWALDAKTGRPVPSFGKGGRIDLREGLGRPVEGLSVAISTPGVVYRDLLIVGSIVPEGAPSAPGYIRAFELKSGKQRWAFRTIPAPGDFGYETWPPETWKHTGGANAWAGLTLDEKRGLVFAPTGSAAYDFYGSDRHGDNLFANSLIALDAHGQAPLAFSVRAS